MVRRNVGTRGFGYQAARSAGYHFEVRHSTAGGITVWERFGSSVTGGDQAGEAEPKERARLSAHRWSLVQGAVANEFNARLRQGRLKSGRWLKQVTPLAPHFGKELVLLIWAIEDQDPTLIPRMLANWRGLAPEERWWFYTTINASARSHAADASYGWKAAIKIAFLDDPRDVGLESLRITAEKAPVAPRESVSHGRVAREKPSESATDDQLQGHLFAEPGEPDP